jgi:integrase
MFIRGTKVTPRMVHSVPAFPARLEENPPRNGIIVNKQYSALAKNANVRWLRCLIACAYDFGFRKGELLNLRVSQVDLLDKSIELLEGETKNGEPRKVFMTTEVFELMWACVRGKNPDDFAFTRGDGSRVVDPRDDWYTLSVYQPAWESLFRPSVRTAKRMIATWGCTSTTSDARLFGI